MQGYNAQAVATEQQIVIAAEAQFDSSDFGRLGPDGHRRRDRARAAGVTDTPAVVSRTPALATGIRDRWRA